MLKPTTGITASNGVVAQDDSGNPIWTLGNDSLLLTHLLEKILQLLN